MYPVLHNIQPESDLSFVGQKDCGHLQFDVEIHTGFVHFLRNSAYILVSLPLIARWHSSEEFDAEQMLRQSERFDYSEPQFFHMRIAMSLNSLITSKGPLNTFKGVVFRCEFEHSSDASVAASALLEHHLPLLSHVVLGEFSFGYRSWEFTKLYEKLSRLFSHETDFLKAQISPYNQCPFFADMLRFLAEFACILHSGDNINQFMHCEKSYYGHYYFDSISLNPVVSIGQPKKHELRIESHWSTKRHPQPYFGQLNLEKHLIVF